MSLPSVRLPAELSHEPEAKEPPPLFVTNFYREEAEHYKKAAELSGIAGEVYFHDKAEDCYGLTLPHLMSMWKIHESVSVAEFFHMLKTL